MSVIFQLTGGGGAYKDFSLLELQNFKICLSFPFFYIFFLASHTMAKLLLINISPHSHMCNKLITDKTFSDGRELRSNIVQLPPFIDEKIEVNQSYIV